MILTADMPRARCTEVLLDDVSVTASCFAADDEAGWVDVWVRDEKGLVRVNGYHELMSERRFGHVVFVTT